MWLVILPWWRTCLGQSINLTARNFLQGDLGDVWRTSHVKKKPAAPLWTDWHNIKQRWSSCHTMPHQGLMVPFIISVRVLMCYIWFVLWRHVTLALLRLMWASSLQELFHFNRLINAHPSIHSLNHLSSRGHRGPEPAGDRIYNGLVYHRANRESGTRAYSLHLSLECERNADYWKVVHNRWKSCVIFANYP